MIMYGLIFVAFGFGLLVLLYLLFRKTTVRGGNTDYSVDTPRETHTLYPFLERAHAAGRELDALRDQIVELSIESFDGLRLYADYLPCGDSKKTVIFMHGFRSSFRSDFAFAVPFWREQGFNILMVDQRCHGRSQGRYITYGIREKYDCRDWVLKLLKEFDPNTEIILAGLSMGASTVLMTAGLDLPENVKGILADCGFTDPYEIVLNTAKGASRYIPSRTVDIINFMCRTVAGFDLRDDNTLNAMQKTEIPIFFVHGTRDALVPFEMTLRNYATCRSEKELLRVVGAEHAVAFLVDEERYTAALSGFLKKHLNAK